MHLSIFLLKKNYKNLLMCLLTVNIYTSSAGTLFTDDKLLLKYIFVWSAVATNYVHKGRKIALAYFELRTEH